MAVFNGNDLVLAIHTTSGSEVAFAHAQSASISFSDSLIDVTTKDSNSWEEMISGRKSFTISTDGLFDLDDVTSRTSGEQFSDYAIAGTQIFFTFQRSANATGGALSTGDQTGWSGSAFIESFEVSAGSDESVSYSVSLKGTGALVKTTEA